MATFTATADSSSTIGYALYGSSTWNAGSSNGACQGAYQSTSSSSSRVGLMIFTNADTVLKSKNITSITLSITCSASGSDSSSKVLTFHKANINDISGVSFSGVDQVGDMLGTLTGKFYSNTTSHILSSSSNTNFFNALSAYLSAGNRTLVLYNGETASSSSTYSTNYARITSITITVEYTAGQQSVRTVWYNNNGVWTECYVYVYDTDTWRLCTPYYNNVGTWV